VLDFDAECCCKGFASISEIKPCASFVSEGGNQASFLKLCQVAALFLAVLPAFRVGLCD
jgi:hypothetical protein